MVRLLTITIKKFVSFTGVKDRPFVEFLENERISGELQKYVLDGMSLCGDSATVEEGLQSTRLFLTSLGRYGTSPFLATLYGSGELPQAFCRFVIVLHYVPVCMNSSCD